MGADIKNLIFSKGRLETLTDGVFAIIMTILVFNITVPELVLFTEGEYAEERLSDKFENVLKKFIFVIRPLKSKPVRKNSSKVISFSL